MSITPGSWEVIPGVYDTSPVTATEFPHGPEIVADGTSIASVHMFGEEDAAVMAAAPELLAACKEFVRKVEAGEARSVRSYAQMKAAIAKAEGTK